jgi:trk system potassium uptake protein TrkA
MQNSGDGSVITLHRIVDGQAEALEFNVTASLSHLRAPLRELSLKPNILIACISRGGKVIIPGGEDFLQEGDTVVVVALAEQAIGELNDIFLPPRP